jgi:hypothetical protein
MYSASPPAGEITIAELLARANVLGFDASPAILTCGSA